MYINDQSGKDIPFSKLKIGDVFSVTSIDFSKVEIKKKYFIRIDVCDNTWNALDLECSEVVQLVNKCTVQKYDKAYITIE